MWIVKLNIKKSIMKNFIGWFLGGLIVVILPVMLWNVWFLDYIDGRGKLVAWLLAPAIAAVGTGIFLGLRDAKKKPVIAGQINPFWGWYAGALIIGLVIVLLSNT